MVAIVIFSKMVLYFLSRYIIYVLYYRRLQCWKLYACDFVSAFILEPGFISVH